MIKVRSCCGCLSLKSGIRIIGCLSIVAGTIMPMSKLLVNDYDWSTPLHAIIFFVIGILLIVGEQKRKSDFIFPSVCLYFVCVILNAPIVLIKDLEIAMTNNVESTEILILIITIAFIAATMVYAYVVVNTLYEELLREEYTRKENTALKTKNVDAHLWNEHQYQYL